MNRRVALIVLLLTLMATGYHAEAQESDGNGSSSAESSYPYTLPDYAEAVCSKLACRHGVDKIEGHDLDSFVGRVARALDIKIVLEEALTARYGGMTLSYDHEVAGCGRGWHALLLISKVVSGVFEIRTDGVHICRSNQVRTSQVLRDRIEARCMIDLMTSKLRSREITQKRCEQVLKVVEKDLEASRIELRGDETVLEVLDCLHEATAINFMMSPSFKRAASTVRHGGRAGRCDGLAAFRRSCRGVRNSWWRARSYLDPLTIQFGLGVPPHESANRVPHAKARGTTLSETQTVDGIGALQRAIQGSCEMQLLFTRRVWERSRARVMTSRSDESVFDMVSRQFPAAQGYRVAYVLSQVVIVDVEDLGLTGDE